MACGKRGLREPNGGRQRGMGGHARSGRPRVFPILSVLCSLSCGSCVAMDRPLLEDGPLLLQSFIHFVHFTFTVFSVLSVHT